MSSHPNEHSARSISAGFSYVEVLLSVVLVGVLLVPALDALRTAITGTPAMAAGPGAPGLQSKLEQVLAAPFSKLYAETYAPGGNTATSQSALFSDAAGSTDRLIVVIYRYDAATRLLSAADTGLVYVSVFREGATAATGLNTLVGRW